MNITFLPLKQLIERVERSLEDSDVACFYDLISLGEVLTKLTTLFLVANLEDDIERTRYRYEYQLVRADGVGSYADTIGHVLVGNAADVISASLRDKEVVEMTSKCKDGSWQKVCLEEIIICLEKLEIQHNQITPKSSLLIWFANFSQLRNKTKGHGSITTQQCAEVNEHLYKSLLTLIENLSIFKRPWAFLHQNYSGKYRVSPMNMVGNSFDSLKKNNIYEFNDGVYCYTDKPRRIKLLFSNTELSYFQIVNGNFTEKGTYEVLNYLTNEKSTCDGKDYLIPPSQLPDSLTCGKEVLEVQGETFTNLPYGLPDYIKREELENELMEVLLDEQRYPIATLKGRGGIGKTSLAIQVISNILNRHPERYDVVIWFSARDVDLFIEGPKAVQAVVANQKDIAIEYFSQIGKNNISSKDITEEFAKQLTHNSLGKALYIFDNFETLTNPLEVYEWLNSYIRLPNKILITSRLSRNFKADYPLDVKGMTDSQCEELIQKTANKFGITDILSSAYINKLIVESDGHPYIIKIILGEVAKDGKIKEIKRIVADKDKVLDALFKRTYSMLSHAARRVFLTLCSWHSVIPQIALESVILRAENEKIDVDASIEELDKCSFIEVNEREDDNFINVPLAATIYGLKELEVSPEKPVILKDKLLLMEFGAGTNRGMATLEAHILKKVNAVTERIKSIEQFEEEVESLECLSSRYPKIWEHIAKIYYKYGALEKAKEAYRELLKELNSPDQKLQYWKYIANICVEDNDWDGESAARAEIVSLPNVPYDEVSYTAFRINKYYSECVEEDMGDKKYLIEKVIFVMETRSAEANARDFSRLAWLFLNRQDEVMALRYAQRGLQMDPSNQHCYKLVTKLSGSK